MAARQTQEAEGNKPERSPGETDESQPSARRQFFSDGYSTVGWWGLAAFVGGSLLATLRFFFPNVLLEPPTQFKLGLPDDYTPGSVATRWKRKYRLWVVRSDDGSFHVLSGRCTHLGCTPNWTEGAEDGGKFKCP